MSRIGLFSKMSYNLTETDNQTRQPNKNMKTIKILALLVCASALLTTGCSSSCCHKKAEACSANKPSCGMKCCADAKTDCAHCPMCSAKK